MADTLMCGGRHRRERKLILNLSLMQIVINND